MAGVGGPASAEANLRPNISSQIVRTNIYTQNDMAGSFLEGAKEVLTMLGIQINPPEEFQDGKNRIIEGFEKGLLCKRIDDEYLEYALSESLFIILITTGEDVPLGFCTGRRIDSDSSDLYIDLICSNQSIKGTGKHLMTLMKVIANYTGISKISLNSVGSQVAFYERVGFAKNERPADEKHEDKSDLSYMSYKVRGGRRRTRRRRRR